MRPIVDVNRGLQKHFGGIGQIECTEAAHRLDAASASQRWKRIAELR